MRRSRTASFARSTARTSPWPEARPGPTTGVSIIAGRRARCPWSAASARAATAGSVFSRGRENLSPMTSFERERLSYFGYDAGEFRRRLASSHSPCVSGAVPGGRHLGDFPLERRARPQARRRPEETGNGLTCRAPPPRSPSLRPISRQGKQPVSSPDSFIPYRDWIT